MKYQPEFISLFTGGGGLDIGFEFAGWRGLYASDIDECAVATLLANQGKRLAGIGLLSHAVIERSDVRSLTGKAILSKISRKKGEVPLLVGGPPCQSWSSAGHQLGFEDPRGQLFRDYVRIAVETGVRWIVFENVRGLLTARGLDGRPGSALQHIREALLQAGFQTQVQLLNAADYGVAQRRVRLCVMGYRFGDAPPFPAPTHAKEPDLLSVVPRWCSMEECLASLAPLSMDEVIRPSDSLARELANLAPGSGVKSPGKPETTRPGGHWGYKQGAFLADPRLPARTVTASAQQDWIRDPALGIRRLAPRECAALQSFPEAWEFAGNKSDQYRQIGNAVPPRLAFEIALALKAHVMSQPARARAVTATEPLPLPPQLLAAIKYTLRDESRNGESRRLAPLKRRGLRQAELGQ